MHGFLLGTAAALGVVMLLSLYRVLRGPTHFDRLTGLGLIGSKTVVLLVILGVLTHQTDLIVDLALTYALVSFIGTLGLAKFFESRRNMEL